jgi:hypothetical protein
VTIYTTGYYYLYLSAGVLPYQPSGLTILKSDGSTVFGVRRTSNNHNGVDTIAHGAIVQLNAYDQIRVVSESNTAGFSSSDGRQTSFFGALIKAI